MPRTHSVTVLCVLQPAIFALVCIIFRVRFKEVPPPIHPKTEPDVPLVLTIDDSCNNLCEGSVVHRNKDTSDAGVKRISSESESAVNSTRVLTKSISADSSSHFRAAGHSFRAFSRSFSADLHTVLQ